MHAAQSLRAKCKIILSSVSICYVFPLACAEFTLSILHYTLSIPEASHSVNINAKTLCVNRVGKGFYISESGGFLIPSSGVVAMEDVTRLVSTGDTVKIWDAGSMAPLEQFNPHSISHPVAQACWSSNSILSPGCGRSL